MSVKQLVSVIIIINESGTRGSIYLEYVGDNGKVMFILLLVELLQVGGVVGLTVSSHLVPHLSLLSCLRNK